MSATLHTASDSLNAPTLEELCDHAPYIMSHSDIEELDAHYAALDAQRNAEYDAAAEERHYQDWLSRNEPQARIAAIDSLIEKLEAERDELQSAVSHRIAVALLDSVERRQVHA